MERVIITLAFVKMERLRIISFDSMDSIESYLGHFKKNEVAVGAKDKLFSFLDICKIEYEIVGVYVSNDEICSQEVMEQLNNTKTDTVAICFSCNKDVFILSVYYAVKKGCNCIFANEDNVQSIIEKASKEYKRCCVITDEFSAAYVQTIVSTCNASLGIIAGRNSWETLFIINKSIAATKKSINNIVSVDRTDHAEQTLKRLDNYTYIPFNDSFPNILLEAIKGVADIFSFMGHGKDELLWLKKGLLCSGIIAAEKTGNLPNCRITGNLPDCRITGKCFEEDTEVLPISDIPSLSVFVNACLTGKIGRAFYGGEHNVAQSFLGENAVTYMGTPFLGKPFEAVVHYYVSLVNSGMKMGDVCRIINTFYRTYQINMSNEFFLFGDPDFCFDSAYPIFKYSINDAEDNVIFELQEKTPLIVLHSDGNLFDDYISLTREVTLVNEANQPIYCNMIQEGGNKTFVHVFTRGLLEKGIYKFEIKKHRLGMKWDIDNIACIENLIRMGLTNSKIDRFYQESINAVDNFKQCLNYNMARLDTIDKTIYSKYSRILNRVDSIHRSIVQEVQRKVHISGIYFEDYCMEKGFKEISREISECKCRYCGSELFNIDVFKALFSIKRRHVFCIRCGTISSSPENETLNVYFECEERQRKNETYLVSLCIENQGDTISTGVASIAIRNGKQKIDAIYTPEQITFEIGPTEKYEFVFEINTKKDHLNRHTTLVGIVLANSHFYTTTRPVLFYDDLNTC